MEKRAVHVEFDIPSTDAQGRVFLTWTPVEAAARLLDPPAGAADVTVTLRNGGSVGRLVFDVRRSDEGEDTLELDLPTDGSPVSFWVAGEFLHPSEDLDDAAIEAVGPGSAGVIGTKAVTVRIRKNANTLTTGERDRFLTAFSVLNGSGAGRFSDLRDMHRLRSIAEAHGDFGFPPWHRAYLLDLERELQAIDPSVALPYWRFDQAAPKVFSLRFMGLPNSLGRVQFNAGHPLIAWRTDNQPGITRRMGFQPDAVPPNLLSEAATLTLGGPGNAYGPFEDDMEIDPHGRAHTRFRGFVSSLETAARDPLFFMLHCNVDRLWAKWQWMFRRMDPADPDAYQDSQVDRIGHRLNDTMWPWNQDVNPPRPNTAPGGALAASFITNAPGPAPTVRSMIDFQGVTGVEPLGFAYDDVPFEL